MIIRIILMVFLIWITQKPKQRIILGKYPWLTYSKNTKDKEEAFYGECLFFYIFAV